MNKIQQIRISYNKEDFNQALIHIQRILVRNQLLNDEDKTDILFIGCDHDHSLGISDHDHCSTHIGISDVYEGTAGGLMYASEKDQSLKKAILEAAEFIKRNMK